MPFFINADLEILSKEDLGCIRDAFDGSVLDMGYATHDDGSYFTSFEMETGLENHHADQLINQFCDLVSRLSPEEKLDWDSAISRVIDLGYQTDDGGRVTRSIVSSQAMKRMSEFGIDLAITVYPLEGKLS